MHIEDKLWRVDQEEIAAAVEKARTDSASYFAVFEPDRKMLTAGFLASHSVLDAVRDFDPMFGRFSRLGFETRRQLVDQEIGRLREMWRSVGLSMVETAETQDALQDLRNEILARELQH